MRRIWDYYNIPNKSPTVKDNNLNLLKIVTKVFASDVVAVPYQLLP